MFVCCGLATPIDLVTNTRDASKSFLLGLQVAAVASDGHNRRGANAPRSVQWRNNNKVIESSEETPIYAHSFPLTGSAPILLRRVEAIRELSSILGVEANTRLRALLQSSELFSVLSDSGLISRSNTLTFLCSYSAFEDADKKEALENAILKSAVASFASELDAERTEQGQYYTEERRMKALQRFAAKAQLVASLPSALGYEPRNTDGATALLGELVAMAPKLEASRTARLQAGAAGGAAGGAGKGAAAAKGAAAGKEATAGKEAAAGKGSAEAAQSKRGKEAAQMGGNSPEGKVPRPARGVRGGRRKRAPKEDEVEDVEDVEDDEDDEGDGKSQPKNLRDMMSAAAKSNTPSSSSLSSSSSHLVGLTPMAVACQVSDPTRLRELEGEVKDLTIKLADVRLTLVQIKAEKGALEAENARLRTSLAQTESQLTSVSADLAAKSQSLAVAGMQVEAAQVTTDELRQDRAMWSSLFMSTTTSFDANKFQSLMGSLMRDPSKKADGGAGGSS